MTAIATPRHRVSDATAQMRGLATDVSDAPVWSMTAVETADTLVELTSLEAQITELKARVAAHADDLHVGQEVGASSAANWLAHQTKATRSAAHGAVRLGRALEQHPATRDALAAGDVLAEQAQVILRWVDRLPDGLGAAAVEKAERHLLAKAREHDAKELNTLGKRLFEVVAPDEADAREAAILEQQEQAAAKKYRLTLFDDDQGITRGTFALPTAIAGAALRKALTAIAAPKHQRASLGAGVERRPTPEALGRAFAELITRYPVDRLPKTGGLNATVVVTMDLDVLTGRLEQAGVLDTGERISPDLARQLACEAGVVPVVLDGKSQPLDLGRRRRLFTEAQRLAMFVRDGGCRAEGCDRTSGLHAHHKKRWADGGATNLADGISLCHWHHNRAHDTNFETTYHPNGDVSFHRRT